MAAKQDIEIENQRVRELCYPAKSARADMADAHAEGLHDDLPRGFCPECDNRGGR